MITLNPKLDELITSLFKKGFIITRNIPKNPKIIPVFVINVITLIVCLSLPSLIQIISCTMVLMWLILFFSKTVSGRPFITRLCEEILVENHRENSEFPEIFFAIMSAVPIANAILLLNNIMFYWYNKLKNQ